MTTLEEITLTPEQDALLCALLSDIQSAPSELKMLVRLQMHVKKIWNAGYAAAKLKEDTLKEQLGNLQNNMSDDGITLLDQTEKAEIRGILKKRCGDELRRDLERCTEGGLLTVAQLIREEIEHRKKIDKENLALFALQKWGD